MTDDLLTLARQKGTDAEYRAWIQRQPSCLSGQFSEWVDGEGRCEAAHVRRARDSGTGYKAEYSCIPLTRVEHAYQHQHGEHALLIRHTLMMQPHMAREWFDKKRIEYLKRWINFA